MRSGDSRNPSAAGILPAQDHSRGVPLEHRSGTLAWRVVAPPTRFGEIQYDAATVGDVTGWTLWETASRPIPGWRQAWPSIVPGSGSTTATGDAWGGSFGPGSEQPGNPIWMGNGNGWARGDVPPGSRKPSSDPWHWNGPGEYPGSPWWNRDNVEGEFSGVPDSWLKPKPGGGGGAEGGLGQDGASGPAGRVWESPTYSATYSTPPLAVSPVDGSWTSDSRYRRKNPKEPRKIQPFPAGTIGITLESTDETKQTDLFFHADPRLIAAHYGPTPSYGTLVCDVTSDGEIDPGTSATLQTLAQVIRRPTGNLSLKGNKANSISWTIGLTGHREALGGFVTDGAGSEAQHARVSVRDGGFLDIGPFEDKHLLGTDADNRNINPAHLSTLAFWNDSGEGKRDGPMRFEDENYPAATTGPVVMKAPLKFDPEDKYEWPRDSKDYKSAGRWRWHSYCMFGATTPGGGIPDTKEPTDPPPDPDGPGPGTPGGDDDGGPTTPGGGGGGWTGGSQQRVTASADRLAFPHYGTTPSELSLAVISAHPQPIGDGLPDLFHTGAPSPRALAQHQYRDPVTARSVPYGAQRGGEWTRTQEPGSSRYAGGTASGGWLHLPPETDALDAETDTAPVGVTRSTRTDVWAQGSRIAFGSIDHATGLPKDAVVVSSDGAGGLTIARVVAGTSTTVMTLDATGVAYLRNADAAPSGTPASGGYLYAEAGALKWKGSGGTITTLGVA